MRKIISLLLFLPLVGCQFFEKKNATPNTDNLDVVADTISKYEKEYPIGTEKYIIDRQGAWFLEEPNTNAIRRYFLEYATMIEVDAEQGDYYKVMYNGNDAYIPKSKVGDWAQISLINSDLNKINFFQQEETDVPDYFDEPIALDSFIDLELIDKSSYEKAKKTAVDFLLRDTLAIVKNNNQFTLPCSDSIVTFKDIDSESDDLQVYQYRGQIQALNSFLVMTSYWEVYDYKLIHKNTAKEVTFPDFPYLSPDKRYIISAFTNPYEEAEQLSLYAVDEHLQIKHIFTTYFTNWQAYNKEEEAFWGSDGHFYLPVNHKAVVWVDGDLNDQRQYVRIKIR